MKASGKRLPLGALLIALSWLLVVGNNALSDQFDHLIPRLSSTSANLNAIAFGAGSYVAVGVDGVVLKSPDSAAWTQQSSSDTNALRSVSYANGLFVAVGDAGTILVSPDGSSWTVQNSGVTNQLNAVASSGGAFVIVGDSGTILYSTNGVNWGFVATGMPYNLNGIVGGGSFVIAGDSGTVLTSPDGLAWTVRSSGSFLGLNAVARSINPSGAFVAVGQSGVVITSPDSVTWTVRNSGVTKNLRGIAVDPAGYYSGTLQRNGPIGTFGIAGDGGTFLTSCDGGLTWTSQADETTNNLRGIAFENGGFVAVGELGSIEAGFVWAQRPSGMTNDLSSVVWGDNHFIAVGEQGTILASTDGADWALRNSGTANALSDVIFADNRFMAVGGNALLISTNGLDWTSRAIVGSGTNLAAVAYGNGVFVTITANGSTVIYSSDGTNWNGSTIPTSGLTGITFGTNLFCAGSSEGAIYTSADGENWTMQDSGFRFAPAELNYCNGQFVVPGQFIIDAGAEMLTSTDGTNWGVNSSGYFSAGASGGHNALVAAGGAQFIGHNLGSAYLTSSDGITWTSRGANSLYEIPPLLNSVTFGNGTFVAVGVGGVIFQSVPSPSSINASLVPQGINIKVSGDIGRNFMLETTTNLSASSWTDLVSVPNAPSSTNFINSVTNAPQRFYRTLDW